MEAIAGRGGFDGGTLRAALERQQAAQTEDAAPTTLEGWLSALFPGRDRGASLKLHWDEDNKAYVGQLGAETTSLLSTSSLPTRHRTAMPGQARSRSDSALRAQDFVDDLRVVVERRALRVLGVSPALAPRAIEDLERELGVEAVALDHPELCVSYPHYVMKRAPVSRGLKVEAPGSVPGAVHPENPSGGAVLARMPLKSRGKGCAETWSPVPLHPVLSRIPQGSEHMESTRVKLLRAVRPRRVGTALSPVRNTEEP